MSAQHTPGPWGARQQYQDRTGRPLGWIIEHAGGRIGWECTAYASTNSEAAPDDPARAANARLIAAAPDLLSALAAMLTHMGMDEDEYNKPTFEQARAAIAKATGSAA